MNLRMLPILLAFLVMGVADAMGPLADEVQKQQGLSSMMATLLPSFVFIAFAVCSVPAGVLAARVGKKRLLLMGLGLNAAAMAVPALAVPSFPVLLLCLFALGIGTTFLQVAGNPIVRDVSEEQGYARNLSLAQGIKGLGSTASSRLVAGVALVPALQAMGWRSAFPVFAGLMVVAFLAVASLSIEERRAEVPPSVGSSLGLLKESAFALAVLGIFLYVGAEVCLARFAKPRLEALGFDPVQAASFGPMLFFAAITGGRLLGALVQRVVSAQAFFRLSALLGLAGLFALMVGSPWLGVAGVVLSGLGFANIWPLLFALTVERRPERGAELSGLMCMAISGGAVVPLLMGRMADGAGLALAFAVPAAAFGYLVMLSFRTAKEA